MVRGVAFCGREYEHVIEVGSRPAPVGLCNGRRFRRAGRCGLALEPEGCYAFAEDAASPQPAPLPVQALPTERLRDPAGALGIEQIERLWR